MVRHTRDKVEDTEKSGSVTQCKAEENETEKK